MLSALALLIFTVAPALSACQREAPTEQSRSPQPPSAIERAAQQSIDAIKSPMDKARGVEETLSDAAERTAERVKEATQ